MTTILVKRGTTDKIATYTGECGELVFDTDAKNLYVMDGETVGGINLSSGSSGDVDGGQLEEPVETHTLEIFTGASEYTVYVYDITTNTLLASGPRDTTLKVEYTSNDSNFGVVINHKTYNTYFYLATTIATSTNCTVRSTTDSEDMNYVITVQVTDVSKDAHCHLYLQPD